MKISDLNLSNIGCFDRIDLSFSPAMNIICGGNGVGKTTILAAIASIFASRNNTSIFKSISSSSEGLVSYVLEGDDGHISGEVPIDRSHPADRLAHRGGTQEALAGQLIHIKSNRELPYQGLAAIAKDPEKNAGNITSEAWNGIQNADLKNWIAQRWIFGARPGSLDDIQTENLEFVIRNFSILGDETSFRTVKANTFDLILDTPDGPIPFEMMSAGFRSVFFIVFGIVKELEFRKFHLPAHCFDGMILIDEVDLHLHPTWQSQIVEKLAEVFPDAQFVVTTHSPHVVQNAKPNQLIVLSRDGTGKPRKTELPSSDYGYAGWSVEEILEDVMELPSSRSVSYLRAMQDFNDALEAEEGDRVRETLKPLMKMLHPGSVNRKILRLQAGPYLVGDE